MEAFPLVSCCYLASCLISLGARDPKAHQFIHSSIAHTHLDYGTLMSSEFLLHCEQG